MAANTLAINVTETGTVNDGRRTVIVAENASISTLKQQIVQTSNGRWEGTDRFKLTFSNNPVVDAFGMTLQSTGMADGCECETNSHGTFQINGYDMSRYPTEVPVNEFVDLKPKETNAMYGVNPNYWSNVPNLPYGLEIDPQNGHITGTPSVKGQWQGTITACYREPGNQTIQHASHCELEFTVDCAALPPHLRYDAVTRNTEGDLLTYGEGFMVQPGNLGDSQIKKSMGVTFSTKPALPSTMQINSSTGEVSGHITASRSCCCGFIACYNNCCCAGTNDVEFEVTASNNRLNDSNSVTAGLKVQIQESVWHDNGWTRAVKHCFGKKVCQPNFCMWTMLALYHVFWGTMWTVYSLSDTTAPFWDRHKLQCYDTGQCYSYTYAEDEGVDAWAPGTSCLLNQSMAGAGIYRLLLAFPMVLMAFHSLMKYNDHDSCGDERKILSAFWCFQIFWFIWLIIWSVRQWGGPHRHNCDYDMWLFSYISMVWNWLELIPYTIVMLALGMAN